MMLTFDEAEILLVLLCQHSLGLPISGRKLEVLAWKMNPELRTLIPKAKKIGAQLNSIHFSIINSRAFILFPNSHQQEIPSIIDDTSALI